MSQTIEAFQLPGVDNLSTKIGKIFATIIVGSIFSFFLQVLIFYLLPTKIALLFGSIPLPIVLFPLATLTGLTLGILIKDDIKGKILYGILTVVLSIPTTFIALVLPLVA